MIKKLLRVVGKVTTGYRWIAIVASILVVGGSGVYTMYLQKKDTQNQIAIEIQEQQVDSLEKINEATLPSNTPTVDDSLRYLTTR